MAKATSQKGTLKSAITAHSEYIFDRNKKVDLMFGKLEADPALRKQFYTDPQQVAGKFKITLSDEEIFASKTLKGVPLGNLASRLKRSAVEIFDNNCGCGGTGTNSW